MNVEMGVEIPQTHYVIRIEPAREEERERARRRS